MTFLYLEFMRKSNSKTINSISKTSNRNSVLLSNSKKSAILKMEFVYNTDAFVFSSTLKKNNLKVFNKSKQIKMITNSDLLSKILLIINFYFEL